MPRSRGSLPILFLIITIVIVAVNFRSPILAVASLVDTITADTGISSTMAGLLTTIPVVCFGLVSPAAPKLARRFGMEWVLGGVFVVLIGGILIRLIPTVPALFAGTIVVGAAIAIGNVILPGFVKREAPGHVGPMTGIYSAAISGGGALGAGVTIPLQHALGLSWRQALGLGAILAGIAIVVLIPWMLQSHNTRLGGTRHHESTGIWRNPLAWQVTGYMGMQSLVFFSMAAWLPTYLIAHGMSDQRAGAMLSISPLAGIAGSFLAPFLASRRPDQRWLIVLSTILCTVGIAGLLAAPLTATIVWVLVFGFGSGMTLSLALTLIGLRSPDSNHAAELSGMAQSVGYCLAATGPFVLGWVHDVTGGWTIPMSIVLAMMVPLLVTGLGAARNLLVADPVTTEPAVHLSGGTK